MDLAWYHTLGSRPDLITAYSPEVRGAFWQGGAAKRARGRIEKGARERGARDRRMPPALCPCFMVVLLKHHVNSSEVKEELQEILWRYLMDEIGKPEVHPSTTHPASQRPRSPHAPLPRSWRLSYFELPGATLADAR